MKAKAKTGKQLIEKIVGHGILEAVGDGISIQDTDYRILYQNKKAIDIIGNHVGEFCYSAFEKRDNICEACPLTKSFEDGRVHTAVRTNPSKNGKLIVEITSSAIKDSSGRTVAGMEVVRDVTIHTQLEHLIFQEKKEWKETFDIINEAITIHDMDFNIVRANKAAKEMLDSEFLKLLKHKCYESYHGSASPPENCPSCRTLKTGLPTTTEMFEPNLRKCLEIKSLPRFGEDRQIIGLVHVVRDITEQKKLEEERNKLIFDLTDALVRVKTLSGLLPICCSCKKIRDDGGYWKQVDDYIRERTDAEFTHGLCPDCVSKQFPEHTEVKKGNSVKVQKLRSTKVQ
ncbi:MAG: PAS domain-containing protein [Nitrospirae bacterium]|nr:PAS domain-containing protein [Nitrospirota bacterium]